MKKFIKKVNHNNPFTNKRYTYSMINYFIFVSISLVSFITACNNSTTKKAEPEIPSGGYCEYKKDTFYYKVTKVYKHLAVYNLDLTDCKNENNKTNYMDLPTYNQPRDMVDSALASKIKTGDSVVVIYSEIIKGSCSPHGLQIKLPRK